MGLLQNLAAVAIRNKVVGALRDDCPADLKDALESLLADKEAINAIQGLVGANLKNPAGINAEAILGLNMSPVVKNMLAATPALVDYLVRTAVSKLS